MKNVSRQKIAVLCFFGLLGVLAYRLIEGGFLQDVSGWIRRLQYRQTGIVKAQGVEFCLPSADWFTDRLLEFGSWEPLETGLVRRELRKGDVFVDVGAHYGYYTLIAAQIVGDAGQVIAFEPDPANFAILKRNVEHNGFRNVVLENMAVSNASGSIRLNLTGSHMEHSTINAGPPSGAIDVKCVRLDDYFADCANELNFIKIDTEGAEAVILQGMQGILREHKNLRLLIEYNPRLLAASGHEPEELLNELRGRGYELQFADNDRQAMVGLPANATSQWTERLQTESTYVNLFLRRRETTP